MNETTGRQETVKRGWMIRIVTAVFEKLFAWLSQYPTGYYTPETMMFMNYGGFGYDESMTSQYISRIKQDATYEK